METVTVPFRAVRFFQGWVSDKLTCSTSLLLLDPRMCFSDALSTEAVVSRFERIQFQGGVNQEEDVGEECVSKSDAPAASRQPNNQYQCLSLQTQLQMRCEISLFHFFYRR